MMILLGRAAESVGDDIAVVSYFMEIEENQVLLRRALEEEQVADKGQFRYSGGRYRALDTKYYGQIAHAINAYILIRAGHSDTEGAVPALQELVAALDKAMRACRLEFVS